MPLFPRVSLLLLLACAATPAAAEIKVVATVGSLGALVRDVGGPTVSVEVLAAPTQDPHFVDARPSLVLKLNQADLLVSTGMELEQGWLPPLVLQARNGKIQAGKGSLEAATLISTRRGPAGKLDRAMGDVHAGGNPHFLYDARAGAEVARGIAQRLAQLDPQNAADYTRRGEATSAALLAFAQAQTARFSALPAAQRQVVAYHESLPYLLDWLTLSAVAFVEPKPGVPPDPGHVAAVLQAMKAANARVLIQEEFYPASTSTTLCKLTGAKRVVLEGNARPDQAYVAYLQKLTDALYAALAP